MKELIELYLPFQHTLRFGQFISNALAVPQETDFETKLYYMDNDELIEIVKEYVSGWSGESQSSEVSDVKGMGCNST
jgi:hypothetical protein